jgi:hypothetical protein
VRRRCPGALSIRSAWSSRVRGWYVTDSRKPAPSENGGSDKAGDKSESGKTKDAVATKSESKSDNGGTGKEPASTTAKTAKTPTKAAAD